jgi:hypothetical protein
MPVKVVLKYHMNYPTAELRGIGKKPGALTPMQSIEEFSRLKNPSGKNCAKRPKESG